jgi:hypothetical protein
VPVVVVSYCWSAGAPGGLFFLSLQRKPMSRKVTITFTTTLMMNVDENISNEELIRIIDLGYQHAGEGSCLSLPGEIEDEDTYNHKVEDGFNYSKD